jgi:sigma-B regulation protein RsbU (phosphoserine phosphatase)
MAKLHILDGPAKGQAFDLDGEIAYVGRSPANDVQLNDTTVSRKHLKVFKIGRVFFVEDLKSRNGTLVNGKPLKPGDSIQVDEGDVIGLGATVMRLHPGVLQGDVDIKKDAPDSLPSEAPTQSVPAQDERRSRSLKELSFIHDLLESIKESPQIHKFFDQVVEFIIHSLPRIDRAAVFRFDDSSKKLREVVTRSKSDHPRKALPYHPTVLNQVLETRKAIWTLVKTHEAPEDLSEQWGTLELRSVVCIPLISGSKLLGAIYLDGFGKEQAFRDEDLIVLKSLSTLTALGIEKANAAAKEALSRAR